MTQSNVVHLTHRHTLIRGDQMELMVGKTKVIIHPCEATEEEQEQAERDLHMAMWAIAESLWEKGEEAS